MQDNEIEVNKYPIGIQDFEKLIKNGYTYVDKTRHIFDLCQRAGSYFISRPRRFGKSLLVSTMEQLFAGKKELFEGTYIHDKWDWTKTYPLVRLDFNSMGIKEIGLTRGIQLVLEEEFRKWNIEYVEKESIAIQFKNLIAKLSKMYGQVVILIDEYDKPIVDYIGENDDQAKENRDVLKSFYSILKSSDEHIKLLFITGISKFSKVSIFSDLNQLNDITLDKHYGGICGITEEELLANFGEELKQYDLNEIQEWYNGYTWDRQTRVYNPFSLLNFFSKGEYLNFWYQSGSPTFLWRLLQKDCIYDIKNIEADLLTLDHYDIGNLPYKTLLYQTGYLTFDKELARGYYSMRFPNFEVEQSFNKFLWKSFRDDVNEDAAGILLKLKRAVHSQDLDGIKQQIASLFKSLPYDFMSQDKEVVMHAIIHLTFVLLNAYVVSEVHTHNGRCDSMVITDKTVYAFEFKLGKTAQEALQQIKEKGYLEVHRSSGKKLIGIGVNYNKSTREIDGFEWEEV